MNEAIKQILTKINSAQNIAIISHIRPDGDTIGSALALHFLCKKLGKDSQLFCEDIVPKKLTFMKDSDKYQTELDEKAFDLLIAVDCGDMGRVGKFQYQFVAFANTINIDHHVNSQQKYAKINWVDSYAATCEMIYELIMVSNVQMDEDMANSLYVGISTDTGNFMHNSTNEHTFECAKNLIGYIKEVNVLCNTLYRDNPLHRFKLLADIMYNANIFEDNKIVIFAVTFDKLNKYGAQLSDTEGFVDNAINIVGCEVGICMIQTKERVFKISFRSKGKVDVYKIANVFGGGGHKFAAACSIFGDKDEIIEKLVKEVQFYL